MRHCEKIYAPGVDFTVNLLDLIICSIMGWYFRQADVNAAFLNGDID